MVFGTSIKTLLSVIGATALAMAAIAITLMANKWKAERIVACAAGRVWGCESEAIKVVSVGPNTYRLTGCNHEATVACKGPADGCLQTSTSDVLLVRECRDSN